MGNACVPNHEVKKPKLNKTFPGNIPTTKGSEPLQTKYEMPTSTHTLPAGNKYHVK